MKTITTICLIVVVFGSFFPSTVSAQVVVDGWLYRNAEDAKEGQAYHRAKDADDRNEVQINKSRTFSIYERLDDARQVFKKAGELVNTKEERELMDACQKLRETGIVFSAHQRHSLSRRPQEVCRATHAGPFFSKEGIRDDWLNVQISFDLAYDNFFVALQEYSKILSRSSEKTKLGVMVAISEARDKKYQADHCRYCFRTTNKVPEYGGFFSWYLYLCLIPNPPVRNDGFSQPDLSAKKLAQEVRGWKKLFEELTKPIGKEPAPVLLKQGYSFELLMDTGSYLGGPGSPMPTRDEFLFFWRQRELCWNLLVNPPEETSKDSPRYTYWQRERDPDSNEPPLVLKVRVNPPARCGTVYLPSWLPNSFLMGLYFQGEQPTESADEFYSGRFAEQRLLWHRRTSDSEYEKQKTENEEFARAHPNTAFAYKQGLCVAFERLSPMFRVCNSADQFKDNFTLEALEAETKTVVVKTVAVGSDK